MLCRGKLQLRQSNVGCQTARISNRVISEVVVSHSTDFCGLLLVALGHCNQAQEHENGTVDETNIGGGGGVLCLECLDGQVIHSEAMVGHGSGCRGLLLVDMALEPCPGARGLYLY